MGRTKTTKRIQNNPKKRIRETSENIDRISDLPIPMLCHILSFLPIKMSITTTCTLSRGWRHVWKNLEVLKFVEELFSDNEMEGESFKDFAQFVNTILMQRRVRGTKKFILACEIRDDGMHHEVVTWIRGATGPHLQEMNINVSNRALSSLVLPQNIFTCIELVSLTLNGKMGLGHLSSVRLPALKNLELEIDCKDHVDRVLGGCPVLETLHLGVVTIMNLLDAPKLDFSQFCCLVHLHLEFPIFGSRFMIDFLHCCPVLQILRISINETYGKGEYLPYVPWTKPTSVPDCLMIRLKTLKFSQYRDSVDEHAFVAYVMKKGQVLETVEIDCCISRNLKKKHIHMGLSVIPRASTNCQLILD